MAFYIRGNYGNEKIGMPCCCPKIRPCSPPKKVSCKPEAFRHISVRFTWDCSPRWYFRI